MQQACPCGSGRQYSGCCGPLIEGRAQVVSARQLMRSRYSAYVCGNVDYLLQTTLPPLRASINRAAIEASVVTTRWIGLDVHMDQELDNYHAQVSFTAHYIEAGRLTAHHELSQFQRLNQRWYYTTGSTNCVHRKLKANEPCPCGSGAKAKRCCAR